MRHTSYMVEPARLQYYRQPLDVNQFVWGTPGASLEEGTGFTDAAIKAGVGGEQKVGAELERIAANYPNLHVFHSVKLFGAKGDIDHILVQGNTVLLVDTKNWKRDKTYTLTSSYDVDASGNARDIVFRDGQPFEGGTIWLSLQMGTWKTTLNRESHGGTNWNVYGVLTVANDSVVEVDEDYDGAFNFVNVNQLEGFLARVFSVETEEIPPLRFDYLRYFADMVQSSTPPVEDKKPVREVYHASFVDEAPRAGWTVIVFFFVALIVALAGLPWLGVLVGLGSLFGSVWYLVKIRPTQVERKRVGLMVTGSVLTFFLLINMFPFLF